MAIKYYFIKDQYQTGPLPEDVKAINPIRPEIVVNAQDAIDDELESGESYESFPRQIYKSIRPRADGVYFTGDAEIQAVIEERVADYPHLFAGPYNSLAEAQAARDALIPLTTHIERPEESES